MADFQYQKPVQKYCILMGSKFLQKNSFPTQVLIKNLITIMECRALQVNLSHGGQKSVTYFLNGPLLSSINKPDRVLKRVFHDFEREIESASNFLGFSILYNTGWLTCKNKEFDLN